MFVSPVHYEVNSFKLYSGRLRAAPFELGLRTAVGHECKMFGTVNYGLPPSCG